MVVNFEVGKKYRYNGKIGDPSPFVAIGIEEQDALFIVSGEPLVCTYVENHSCPFIKFEGMSSARGWTFTSLYHLFDEVVEDPAPEPTYAERQAEWVKENGVKEGTRIRITKDYSEDSDARTLGHTGVAGRCGSVNCVGNSYINVDLDSEDFYLLTVPYYAMEVIKEPTYKERQAEWVAKNNVKEGTKVRFTKNFTNGEDGSWCCEHKRAKGMEGVVEYTKDDCLTVLVPYFGGLWNVPFTALEVIKEPTYRPYNNDELNDLVGEVLTNKKSGRRKLVTGKPTEGLGVNLDGSYINANNLLSSFYRNTTEPCGIKK